MPKVAKIKITHPHTKTAIVFVIPNGRGIYDIDEVDALITRANTFKKYLIILHGNDTQCEQWKTLHAASLTRIKHGTEIINWSTLQRQESCIAKRAEFDLFLDPRKTNAASDDLREKMLDTVRMYLRRNPGASQQGVMDFIVEEMAYLIQIAVERKVDCFVYTGEELPALLGAKRHFLTEGYQRDLLQWAELTFGEMKVKARKERTCSSVPKTTASASSGSTHNVVGRDGLVQLMVARQQLNRQLAQLNMQLDSLMCYATQIGGSVTQEQVLFFNQLYTQLMHQINITSALLASVPEVPKGFREQLSQFSLFHRATDIVEPSTDDIVPTASASGHESFEESEQARSDEKSRGTGQATSVALHGCGQTS